MPTLKLSYFDVHGGRGEAARLALSLGGIAFEDDRVAGTDWGRRKPEAPYGGLPVLSVDGEIVAQSNAINRYVGKLAGLYPAEPWQAAVCDEVMDAVEDMVAKMGATFSMPDEQKKLQREALVASPMPVYFKQLERRLEGRSFFGGERLSIADLKVFAWIRSLKSGVLDHVPRDLVDRLAPELSAHCERVRNHAGIRAYYAKHGVTG
jgi:glutathione S-transferase